MLLLSKLVSYLTDPIFLLGVILVLCFLIINYLLRTKKLKQLSAGLEQKVHPMVWRHGYLLGLLIIMIGISIKHSELELAEQ